MAYRLICGDSITELAKLPAGSVHCCVTSPPYYGLRDYGTGRWEGGEAGCAHKPGNRSRVGKTTLGGGTATAGHQEEGYRGVCAKCGAVRVDSQIGLEETPEIYIAKLVALFREVWRVLRDDGTLWVNIGDSYASGKGTCKNPGGGAKSYIQEKERYPLDRGNIADLRSSGLKPKDMIGIPWMLAFALRADGWYLRSEIIWHKPNPMPESVTDRPTKAHEQLFLLAKTARYYFDAEAIKEAASGDVPGNNNHKYADAYEAGDESHRTTSGLAAYAERQRSKRDSFKRENSKRAVVIPGQTMGTHRPDREESAWNTAVRNRRSVWTVATHPYREAHFATFPPKLIEPCIMAGTSEKGCCPVCGAPWVRVVEKEFIPQRDSERIIRGVGDTKPMDEMNRWTGFPRGATVGNTTGWRAGCKHEAEPVPCVVLDCFSGSGTTGAVAKNLRRDYVGIDLNPAYIRLAEKRIGEMQERLIP